MSKVAIVNFTTPNHERYRLGQLRQAESLKSVGYKGDYFSFNSFEEIGSPIHQQVPYAFKPYAIKKVVNMGYDIVIWMDAPVYAFKPLDTLIARIDIEGYYLMDNIGYRIGDYTSDACLELMGMSREDSFKEPMIMACMMGLNMNSYKGKMFFEHYLETAKIPGCYEGDWTNEYSQVSKDLRVKGHRHDQSVASILAKKLNMNLSVGHKTFFTYFAHPAMQPISDSVCLYSAGY